MNKFLKRLILIFLTIVVIGALVGQYFCPLFHNLPQPTGPYSVGNVLYHWRTTQTILDPKYQEFNGEVFYPTTKAQSLKKFNYQPHKIDALKEILATDSSIPRFIWKQLLSNITTFTEPNTPLAPTESLYPVILYLPGIGSEDLHNVYLEELASHGYVVVAIEPPYDVLVSVFPDKIITIDPVLKKAVKDTDRTQIYTYRNQAHVRWNYYIESSLKNIHELNVDQKSIFYQKLDLEKIGLIGHSHGGAVVTDFCQKNIICKAGINMDGWTKTYNSGQSFDTPFLFLLSESGEMPEMHDLFKNNKRPDFKKVVIAGAGHGAFSDGILTKQPLAQWLGVVTKGARQVRKHISENIVTFFNTYLKNK
jgi:dienelactone hydrolase